MISKKNFVLAVAFVAFAAGSHVFAQATQAAYQKRRTDLMTPLQEQVGKALDKFAKDHGITLIIDGSQVPGVLFAAESMDVTKVFISDYNAKNPATASAATPR